MFRLKTFNELTEQLINWIRIESEKDPDKERHLSDFSRGSKIRVILEAVAFLFASLYEDIKNSIEREIIEGVYVVFGFSRLPAIRASGKVRFYREEPASQDIEIPEGTVVATKETKIQPAIYYEVIETVILKEGDTEVEVEIEAQRAGAIGNVPKERITEFISKPVGIDGVINDKEITGGKEPETNEERRERFHRYLDHLYKGTKNAIRYGVLLNRDVDYVDVLDNPHLYCYLYDKAQDEYEDNSDVNNPVKNVDLSMSDEDELYFGADSKFKLIAFSDDVQVSSGNGVWEYYDGENWISFDNVTYEGNRVIFDTEKPPIDWRDSYVNDQWAFWVRFVANTSISWGNVNLAMVPPLPGFVDVYIQTEVENELDVLNKVADVLEQEYRAAGITINVRSPVVIEQDIECNVRLSSIYQEVENRNVFKSIIEDQIERMINNLNLSQHLHRGDLVRQIINTEDGELVVTAEILTPSKDVLVSTGELIRPGTITVNIVN